MNQYHTGLSQVEDGMVALWGCTMNQHHTGLRQIEVGSWCDSSIGTHNGPKSHWDETG